MMKFGALIVLIFQCVITNGNEEQTSDKLMFCSFLSKSTERPNLPIFNIEDFDPTLCTHIIYNFAEIDTENHGIRSRFPQYDFYEKEGKGLFNRTMQLKEKNPHLKIILRVCCMSESFWNNDTITTDMITSNFLKNVINYMQLYGFEGLLFNGDEPHLGGILSPLRQEFDKHGYILINFGLPTRFKGQKKITRDSVEPYHFLIAGGYWKIMFHSTYPFSPLPELRSTITEYLEEGIPPEKLIVPIPAVGMSYKLCNRNDTGIYAEVCGDGEEGLTKEANALILYVEFMQKMNNETEGWVVARDNSTGMMYGHSNSLLWTSYEDIVSVEAKVQYTIERNLAGVAIMSLENDDFVGYNEEGVKFPLTKAIYNALRRT